MKKTEVSPTVSHTILDISEDKASTEDFVSAGQLHRWLELSKAQCLGWGLRTKWEDPLEATPEQETTSCPWRETVGRQATLTDCKSTATQFTAGHTIPFGRNQTFHLKCLCDARDQTDHSRAQHSELFYYRRK